jgi:hypothetical protein
MDLRDWEVVQVVAAAIAEITCECEYVRKE